MTTLHALLLRDGRHDLIAAIERRLAAGEAVVMDYRTGNMELARGGRDPSQSAGVPFEPGLVAQSTARGNE